MEKTKGKWAINPKGPEEKAAHKRRILAAIQQYRQSNGKISLRKVSSLHSVSKSTLCKWIDRIKRENKWNSAEIGDLFLKSPHSKMTYDDELAIKERILATQRILSCKEISAIVQEVMLERRNVDYKPCRTTIRRLVTQNPEIGAMLNGYSTKKIDDAVLETQTGMSDKEGNNQSQDLDDEGGREIQGSSTQESVCEEMMIEVKIELPEQRQCRICRSEDLEVSFSMYEEDLKEIFSQLTGIEIKVEDQAPKMVCETCRSQLISFSLFRTVCIESNSFFVQRSDIMEENVIKKESEDEIEECSNIFVESLITTPQALKKVVRKKSKAPKRLAKKKYKPKTKKKAIPPVATIEKFDDSWKIRLDQNFDTVICDICHEKFKRKAFLWHWRWEHLVEETSSTCTLCRVAFPSIYQLEKHQRNEHGILKCFKCDSRPTVYSREPRDVNLFLRHLQRCKLDKSEYCFECRNCNDRLVTYKGLLLHESKCTGSTILCHVCSKVIPRVNSKYHFESHTTEGFPCRICGRYMPNIHRRGIHERAEHTDERVVCHHCSKAFPNKFKLLTHIRSAHLPKHVDKRTKRGRPSELEKEKLRIRRGVGTFRDS